MTYKEGISLFKSRDTQTITAKNNTYANKTYSNSVTVSGDFTLKPYLNLN